MTDYVYLACPYSHPDETVREQRVMAADKFAAVLMDRGHAVFSPVSQGHRVARFMDDELRLNSDFWFEQFKPMLAWAARLIVLKLDGWEQSKGIRREIEFAREQQMTIEYAECPW